MLQFMASSVLSTQLFAKRGAIKASGKKYIPYSKTFFISPNIEKTEKAAIPIALIESGITRCFGFFRFPIPKIVIKLPMRNTAKKVRGFQRKSNEKTDRTPKNK